MFPPSSRRSFLAAAVLAPVASLPAIANANPIRFGGPIFLKSDDPAELAGEHRRLGYSAAYCPAAKLTEPERIRAIENAFREAHVVVSAVGAWKNMIDPDTVKRRENLTYVTDHRRLAA